MSLNVRKLMLLLEIDDWESRELSKQIRESLNDVEDLRALLSRQCGNQPETRGCYSCESEGYCAFLRGAMQAALRNFEDGIKEIELANEIFRSKSQIWNGAVGLALLGFLYERSGKSRKAILEYKRALDSLEKVYLVINETKYRNRRKALALRQALLSQKETLFRSL